MKKTKKIAILGLLTAFSLIAFLVENLLPPLFIPGAKLGLGNIFILLTIILFGLKEGILVFLVKSLLGALISGNIQMLMYSLPSGFLCIIVEWFLIYKCKNIFGIISISSFGACISNAIQNLVFLFITGSNVLIVYLPYLFLLGIPAGIITGFITYLLIKFTPKSVFDK